MSSRTRESRIPATLIDICMSNGTAYVWHPKDWKTLRTEHRIVGHFDGAVPVTAQATRVLPLKLSNVQTWYLVQLGIARTVEIPKLYQQQGLVGKEAFVERRNTHKIEQLEKYKQTKRLELETMVDKIIEGKRKKGRSTLIPDRNAVIQDELAKITTLPYEMIKVDLHDPWTQTEEDIQRCLIPEPISERDRLRFDVFKDFCYNRKYFLTAGTAFGGDFLAYPGDPLEFHSEFIIICRLSTQIISKTSLISQQRLAQTVKKTVLIAFYDMKDQQLKYERILDSIS